MAFQFDKIYVIESLDPNEETGEELYNSVIRWFEDKQGINTVFHKVETKEELINVLNEIASDCNSIAFKPLIHLEIHGLKDKSGLSLRLGSISWDELSNCLRKINRSSNWNLNLTMAVCYGNYFLGTLTPLEPSPIAGFVGSFEEIFEEDFVPRFDEFYSTLRNTMNLDEAIRAMMNQNRQFENGFAFIDARRIFSDVYNIYLEQQFSNEALNSRYLAAKEHVGNNPPNDEEFQIFVQLSFDSREIYFEKHRRKFFMIDEFPENEIRFPISLNEVL
tara:strand:- start:5480 stop:6307 length:828 start_codon:yes stop_codon:yes gene_type:complete